MDRLKSMGGVSPELMEQAKAAMLAENMDFSEQSEPSKRSGAGMPSVGGFIEQHFDFAQATPDLAYLNNQLKAAKTGLESGRKNSSKERVASLRAQIKKKLKLDAIAKEQLPACCDVYNDPRGEGDDSSYNEDESDFGQCKSGEKMTFGKCAKVGGSGKKEVPDSLKQSKAQVEANLAAAKKRNSKNQIRKAEKALASVNSKIDSYNTSEDTSEFKSGCPKGFRSKGHQTISGVRREVCCSSDGKTCMTADGIPL